MAGKMCKRIAAVLLTFGLCAGFISVVSAAGNTSATDSNHTAQGDTSGNAPSAVARGDCGNDLIWILDGNGVLSISGTGAMSGYSLSGGKTTAPWSGYVSQIKYVVIGKDVTKIGAYAFYGCTNLSEVYFRGTKTQWKSVTIGTGNTALTNATLYTNLLMGDVDMDDKLTTNDLALLCDHVAGIKAITNADALELADVNGDNIISAADLTELAKALDS